jgi:hypothetical protein
MFSRTAPSGSRLANQRWAWPFFRGELVGRQRQGTGDGEAAAGDPRGIVAKPDGPGRIAPNLTDQVLLVPDIERVGAAWSRYKIQTS